MEKIITAVYTDLDNKNIKLELDSSLSPMTFQAILDHLPVKVKINRWGDELYTDPTEIDVKEEENAKTKLMNWMLRIGRKVKHNVYSLVQHP
jgi:uncharacterized protein